LCDVGPVGITDVFILFSFFIYNTVIRSFTEKLQLVHFVIENKPLDADKLNLSQLHSFIDADDSLQYLI